MGAMVEELAYKVCPSCATRASAAHRFCPSCGADISEVSAQSGDPHVGMVLADRYRLDALLGEGAMGAVYRASQTTLNKPFAVKVLHPHLTNDPDSHARFANEAHNAASLNHPNVVSTVDYGRSAEGITYIVMELVDGKSLESIIHEEFPLSRDRIIDLTLQILAALAEAHGLGILHRDLKPENILVQTLRTHGELLKVLDFGIAKLMEDNPKAAARPGLTSQGMVCGTPEYMSPEQSRGFKLDGRSDLYAVGVILYQMLTGRVPFDSESAVEILHKHIHEAPIPPSQILGTEPDALEAVCLKAMSKDREARFANAAEFRDALVAAGRSEAPMSVRCTGCGSSIRAGDKFCAECGTPAPSATQAPPPTRRPTRLEDYSTNENQRRDESTAKVVARHFPLPLTGRDELREAARRRLSQPSPGLVTQAFRGSPGRGKTRLLEEIASLAESLGWRVHGVGAEPSGAAPPLWPIRRLVAEILELHSDHVRTQDLGRAANLVGLSFEALPGLAELFRLQGPASDAEYAVRRRECLAATTQAMVSGGRGAPLLLIFDDLDLYDTASRRVIQRLSRTVATRPVLVLVASAEQDLAWTGAPVTELGPLSPPDVEALLREVVGSAHAESKLPSRLAATAPVTPLQLEHEVRLLAADLDLPDESDEDSLARARLEALDPGDRRLLEVGSVLGVRFDEQDLVRLLGTDPGAPSGWDVDEGLARLHVAGLLTARSGGERLFGHRRLRELTYECMASSRRRALHREAAICTIASERDVTVRAMHLLRAGHPEVIEALSAAADSATASFDDRKAVSLLNAALRAAATLPEQERTKWQGDLVVRLTDVMRFVGHADKAVDQARSLLDRGATNGQTWQVQRALGRSLTSAGRHEEAAQALQKALGATIALGDAEIMLGMYAELGNAIARAGNPDRARRELEEGLDMCTLGEGPRARIGVSLWRYLLGVARLHKENGDLRQARTWIEHALWQAEQGNEELGLMRCHAEMAWILRDMDQSMLGEQHLARALDHARYFGDRLTTAEILIERGRVRAAAGHLEEARRFFDEAHRLAAEVHWKLGMEHASAAIKRLDRHASQH